MAEQSSHLYSNNLKHLLAEMGGQDWKIDLANDIIGPSTVVTNGQVRWKPPAAPAAAPPPPTPTPAPPASSTPGSGVKESDSLLARRNSTDHSVHITKEVVQDSGHGASGHSSGEADAPVNWTHFALQVLAVIGAFALLGLSTPPSFHPHLLSFVLACVIGYSVIWSQYTRALAHPLAHIHSR